MRELLAVFLIIAAGVAQADEPPTLPPQQCVKPPIGQVANACQAIHAESLYRSPHLGDQWIDCEDMSGHHGTAGYGVAAFFASEARPYWHEEIRAHLQSLSKSLPRTRFAQVRKEQSTWEHSLPKLLRAASKDVGYEGGTAAMYIGEGKAMMVVRSRALALACMLEEQLAASGTSDSR